jgi:putative heme iron utilization protein
MNDDHASAVLAYARHYGGISEAKTATMRKVGPEAMELEVDGQPVLVPFDHPLSDSEDAHRTLLQLSFPPPLLPQLFQKMLMLSLVICML